eukprot:1443687-Rhodomonas_salina.1
MEEITIAAPAKLTTRGRWGAADRDQTDRHTVVAKSRDYAVCGRKNARLRHCVQRERAREGRKQKATIDESPYTTARCFERGCRAHEEGIRTLCLLARMHRKRDGRFGALRSRAHTP